MWLMEAAAVTVIQDCGVGRGCQCESKCVLKESASEELRYNSYAIKFSLLKHTSQWFLV